MRQPTLRVTLLLALATTAACTADSAAYEPDWESESPIAGGKADGLLDDLPEIALGGSVTGDVGGDRAELYRIALRRTDRVRFVMRPTSGDLDPHLSFYFGTGSYRASESWSRTDDHLEKVYVAADAGVYVIAARAYRGVGSGDYELSAECIDGPCSGSVVEPLEPLELGDVAQCISLARRCAFAALPRYNGAVGAVRSQQVFTECLGTVSLPSGDSCATACEWTAEGDDDDAASALCDAITAELPFWADQEAPCLAALDGCMSDCYDVGSDGPGGDDLWETTESLCWATGFNGTCPSYARGLEACGGDIRADGARQCESLCHVTTGAFVDDLDTLCTSDADCDNYCDVEQTQAEEECESSDATCTAAWLDDHEAWMCE